MSSRVGLVARFVALRSVVGVAVEGSVDVDPGQCVYFAGREDELAVLLAGGDKSTQRRDIERAIELAKNIP